MLGPTSKIKLERIKEELKKKEEMEKKQNELDENKEEEYDEWEDEEDDYISDFIDKYKAKLAQSANKIENTIQDNFKNITEDEKEIFGDEFISSKILDFATTRPIETISDFELKTKIEKRYYFEPDSRLIDDKALREFCKTHPDIKYLNLANCDKIMDFSPISELKNLEQLDLNNCDYLYEMDFLSSCTKLKVLNVADTDVKYIDAVANMPDLEILNLSSNPVADITPLCHCRKLKDLVLWGCLSLTDISSLRFCTTLRLLDIDSVPVSDLSCLKDLPVLDTLIMDNCNNIKDFSFLKNLYTLKVLACDGTITITTEQLKNFSNLTNLVYLTLNNRKINNIEALKNLVNIKEIQLHSNLLVDLSPLSRMTEVLKIDLSNNSSLSDLSPLHTMKNITSFKLNGTTASVLAAKDFKKSVAANMIVEDFTVFENFKNLKSFYMSGNFKVKDLSPLVHCEKLEELVVTNCMQLENVDFIKYLTNIFLLDLSNNPRIKDLYCITYLTGLRQFHYNGTAVPTVKIANIMKRCTGVWDLAGNVTNGIQKQYLTSAKKRCKMYALRKKIKQ